ncbi:MAG: zf-HC2 domain-containing protein [Acidobacteria bacterium]|nr:zf-HC2 domain-containing protein [Acidobacteriota bacterium]
MNEATRCERIKPALLDLLMDEISPQHRRDVEDHLKTCRTCSEELTELRRTVSLVAAAEKSEEMPRRIRIVAEPENRWAALWRNPARLAFASAGLMCIAIAMLALFRTTVSYQNGNLQIAFGAQAVPSATIPSAAPVATNASVSPGRPLDRAQVYDMISEAMAAMDRERQRDAQMLAKRVSQQMEQKWQQDLSDVAQRFRYFQDAQTILYKGQVQSQQLVSALMQQSELPAAQQQ